jgi:Domain of unknown function (DUF3883)
MTRPGSDWLTGLRVDRLGLALRCLRERGTTPRDELLRHLWRTCGGPHDEIAVILVVLEGLRLVVTEASGLRRTKSGDAVARAEARGDRRPLRLLVLRAGFFFDQARLLLESGKIDSVGRLRCSIRVAGVLAPQLVGVLGAFEGVRTYPTLEVPAELVAELNTVWALRPPSPEQPKWAAERKAVGDRAEMYTMQYERTRVGDPTKIVWVSRDSDSLGWDVEDRSVDPCLCIEVKGRRDHDVVFYLSEQEMRKARELAGRYEIQFWGGIELNATAAVEYASLRGLGYPKIIGGFIAQLEAGVWKATAMSWKIEASSP